MIAYGIFSTNDDTMNRVGAKVENKIIDLKYLAELGILDKSVMNVFASDSLNNFICAGVDFRKTVKQQVLDVLANASKDLNAKSNAAIFDINQIKLHMPVAIGGYTDFYASKQHATNIGKIFRPENPLSPNWLHIPIGYNGRASSVVISGHPVKRPFGQILVGGKPQYGACEKLDIEIEFGVIIGKENPLGEPININNAHEYIFGICVVNDWSARDLQAWEYQPLGPFTSKSFLTSISAFIIPIEELDPYKVEAPIQDPQPLSYLKENNRYTYDVCLEAKLTTKKHPEGMVISKTNFKYMYWSINQWITHHTVSGCNLRVGDMLASGTISGNSDDSFGSLMELTVNGQKSFTLPDGETRVFLEDGDSIVIDGYCGEHHIGTVAGTII